MSNIKISEMTEAESLNDNDLLTIVQSGVNKKITKQNAIGNIITALNDPTYVSGTGESVTLNNTRVGKMKFEYYGNTEQDGNPTPDNPVEVKTVTGKNKITIENEDRTQSQSYKISLGNPNEFDKNNINLIDGYYVDGTGKIVAGSNNKFNWVKLDPQEDYVLYQPKKSNVAVRVALFSSQPAAGLTGTLIATFQGTDQAIELNFETTQTNTYVGWVYCNTSNLNGYTQQEMIDSIKLFKGEELTDYSDNPIELCKIGDYRDYLHKKDGEWYIHKEVEKITFTGNENWADNTSGTWGSNTYGYTGLTFIKPWSATLSNYFTDAQRISGGVIEDGKIQMAGNGLVVRNNNTTTLAAFKTWLAGENVNVYYILATPEDIQITDQNLINQLNALKNDAESYYDTTNITTEGQELDPIITADALEKIS